MKRVKRVVLGEGWLCWKSDVQKTTGKHWKWVGLNNLGLSHVYMNEEKVRRAMNGKTVCPRGRLVAEPLPHRRRKAVGRG
mgnify:CR=1 FL=1